MTRLSVRLLYAKPSHTYRGRTEARTGNIPASHSSAASAYGPDRCSSLSE
jgi:hypothetical protein